MTNEPITIWAPTTINQTARERLAEAIRLGGMAWHRANNPDWRDKPWMDGISVDLDESDVVECIVQTIIDLADPDHQPTEQTPKAGDRLTGTTRNAAGPHGEPAFGHQPKDQES